MRILRINENEKIARNFGKLVNSYELDLDSIGIYVARLPRVLYNRIITVIDSAEQEAIRAENERLGKRHYGYLFE
jgi:hypothetical protein